MIVEDEPLISIMFEEMADELGWSVYESARSEAEALALLQTAKPDVALLDIELSGTNSLGIAALCKARGISVVFTTGYTARDIPAECGTSPVLPKPFSLEEFERALSRALASEVD